LFAFSSGPRACVGKELAWAEMLLILSHLLHRFELELDAGAKITPVKSMLLIPKEKKLMINVRQRSF
jgi:cytochrome P450